MSEIRAARLTEVPVDVSIAGTNTDGISIGMTARFVASDIVAGTVHNFMIDKSFGQVAYAVMSCGSFVVDIDRRKREVAPSYTAGSMQNWADRLYGSRIDQY